MLIFNAILLFFIIFTQTLKPQVCPFELKPQEIPFLEITGTKYFDGNSLWGYINGGADIYLEYGFEKLLLQEIKWQGYHFKIEVYQMNDAEAAFGIYSISRRKCSFIDSSMLFSCYTNYQVQIAHEKLYISIINENGTVEAQTLGKELAKIILKKTNENTFTPPLIFRDKIFSTTAQQLIFIKGKLGIQNGFPQWYKYFEGVGNVSLYILPIETENEYVYTAQINFHSEKDKSLFYKNIKIITSPEKSSFQQIQNGVFTLVEECGLSKIFYLESNLNPSKLNQFIETIRRAK